MAENHSNNHKHHNELYYLWRRIRHNTKKNIKKIKTFFSTKQSTFLLVVLSIILLFSVIALEKKDSIIIESEKEISKENYLSKEENAESYLKDNLLPSKDTDVIDASIKSGDITVDASKDDNTINNIIIRGERGNMVFQADEIFLEESTISISGFCFVYDIDGTIPNEFVLVLKPTNGGDDIEMDTACGIERLDVNKYFECNVDYSKTGFTASANINPKIEYEIIGKWKNKYFSTEQYIIGDKLYCTKQIYYAEPDAANTGLERIVEDGHMLVCRPDFKCWVYQYDGYLYWIADDGFIFDKYGNTYIQYHIWTTQIDRLPQDRLEHEWYWDNIGFGFENSEITGMVNCGKYRVAKKALPTQYSITRLFTGYFVEKDAFSNETGCIWQNYFYPVYDFIK